MPAVSAFKICAVGILSLALAIGIGRFAFTPLLPLMVRDGLLPGNGGAWLASANYIGYMLGAAWASSLSLPSVRQIQGSLFGIVLMTLGMGVAESFTTWIVLRFAAGVLSAGALVATSTWALQALALSNRPVLAGVVYSGVGTGIAVAGLFCLVAAQPGVGSPRLWLELGLLAALMAGTALLLLGRSRAPASPLAGTKAERTIPRGTGPLVLYYGICGFGYILPATFLPALARTLVDDPQRFGLAWPLFGLAAALSTLLAAWVLRKMNRLKIWSIANVFMATGAVLPSLWPTLPAIAIAALCVGGTFMIVTMLGLQEARARAPQAPTALLGRMTSAFALGQVLGPVAAAAFAYLPISPAAALGLALQTGALCLVLSAAMLWRMSATSPRG